MQLIAENLVIARGSRIIVAGVSFDVKEGQALQLVGPNGSGKTTLIRTLAGMMHPAAGDIRLQGGEPDVPLAEHCHYVGHLNGLKPKLSVLENLRFWGEYLSAGEANPDSLNKALGAFDLKTLANIPAGYLSAGQKRRAALARLLAARRPIWLLDEPSVSLDKGSTELLADAIGAHLTDGGLVIAATHIPLGLTSPIVLELGKASAP